MAPGFGEKGSGWKWAQGREGWSGDSVQALGWAAWVGHLVPLLLRSSCSLLF